MTLLELRKIGGFADLERSNRAHPMILLEIIESMMLSQQDPTNALLVDRIKKSEGMTLEQIVAEKIRALNICGDLDAEIAHISSMIDINARVVSSLTFVLARTGRLQSVRVEPLDDSRIGGSASESDIIGTYSARVAELRARTAVLQSSAPQVIGMRARSSAMVPSNERGGIRDLRLEYDDSSPIQVGNATPSERYIARAIQVARIVHSIEAHLEDLMEECKKMRNTLDVLFAQCVVLMSSRATIA